MLEGWKMLTERSCPNTSKHQEKDFLEIYHPQTLWWQNNLPEGQVCGHRWFGDTLHSYPGHFYPLTDKHRAGMSWHFLTYTIISQGFGHSLRVPFTWTMFFSCCRNGSPETSSSSPVLPSRHWAQPKSLLLLLADVLSTRSCSSVFPLSLCSLIQAIKSNCLTTGQTQPSPKQEFFWLFYSPVP